MNFRHAIAPLLLLAAQAPAAGPAKLTVDPVLNGLSNPCGVAVQPNTGAIFVSDTGAGQVVMLSANSSGSSTPVITGFPQETTADTSGKEPAYNTGPLGLAFYNQNTLIVGEGALKPGDELVRIFDIADEIKPQNYNTTKQKLSLYSGDAKSGQQNLPNSQPSEAKDKKAAAAGEADNAASDDSKTGNPNSTDPAKSVGNFFGVAVTPTAIVVTARGPEGIAYVLKADVRMNPSFNLLKPFIQTKAETKIDALLGIVYSKHGFIVLGPRDESATTTSDSKRPRQSLLNFYNAKNGNLLMSLPTTLHDITGLSYSPKTGRLYALDFGWDDPSQCGLYRLDSATIDGRVGVKAVKITPLDKPTALSFAADNTLYVTTFGSLPKEPKSDKPAKPGQLIKIIGDL